MNKPFEPQDSWNALREKIIGLGEAATRKSHYPELQRRLAELERFRLLLDQGNDGILLLQAPLGQIVDANASACRMLECSKDELLAHTIRDCLSAADAAEIERLFQTQTAYDTRDLTLVSSLVGCKDRAVPVEMNIRLATLQGEQYAIVVVRDISERLQVQEALRINEERLKLALEGANDGLWDWDIPTGAVYFSPRWQTMLGYEPGEVPGRVESWSSLVHPEDISQVMAALNAHLQGRTAVYEAEHRVKTKSGDWLWILDRGKVVERDAAGAPLRAVGTHTDISERKAAEETLRTSEEKFRNIIESLPLGIHLYELQPDNQLIFIGANPAADRILGVKHQQFIGQTLEATFPGLIDTKVPEQYRRTAAIGELWHTDQINYKHNQIQGAYEVHAFQTSPGRMVAAFMDITARKRAEETLRSYTERLRMLHAIDGAILGAWSPEEIMRAAMRHTQTLLPYQRASIWRFDFNAQIAQRFIAFDSKGQPSQHDVLPLAAISSIAKLQRGMVLIEQDVTATASPEFVTERDADIRSHLIVPLIAHGELIGALVLQSEHPKAFTYEQSDVAQEIANQLAVALHQAQLRQDLETEEKRLATLIEYLPEGILLLDERRRLLLANPAAHAYLEHLTPTQRGETLELLGNVPVAELLIPTEGSGWRELRWPHTENRADALRIFELAAQPVGAAQGWVIVIREVTKERKLAEQTQHQERMAAVGQLAAGIAHDFNNILAVIVLYAQMALRDPALPPHLNKYINTVSQQAYQATEMITQILDFSRRAVLERRPLLLTPFLKEFVKLMARTLPENIHINLDIAPGDYTINGDPTRLQQALLNMIINARDAMPEGGELRIGLERIVITAAQHAPLPELAPGAWLQLSIQDTGVGIPSDTLPRIFEPFFTTKAPGEGTGLGLAQVYGIVKLHDGEVIVNSQVGMGTTFTLYLPALMLAEPQSPEPPMNALPHGCGQTILLVEDSSATRAVLLDSLTTLNYRVLEAIHGKEALAVLEAHPGEIALILSDVVMPEMGGIALLHEVRARGLTIPLILITGHPMREQFSTANLQGLSAWLFKPPSLETLAQTVARCIAAADD